MGTPLDKIPGVPQLSQAAPALGLYNPTVIGASGAPFVPAAASVLAGNPSAGAPLPVQAPALAPTPVQPTRDSPIVRDARSAEEMSILQRRGRAASILTSPAGDKLGA